MVILTRWFWGSFVIEKLVLKRMGVHLSFHWMCFRWASAECWANKLFEKISYRLNYIVTVRWFGWQPTRNMMTEEAPFRFRSFVYFQGIRWWILHWIPEIKNLPSHSKEFPLHNVFGSKAFLALHNSLDKSQNVSDDKQLDEEDIHLEVNKNLTSQKQFERRKGKLPNFLSKRAFFKQIPEPRNLFTFFVPGSSSSDFTYCLARRNVCVTLKSATIEILSFIILQWNSEIEWKTSKKNDSGCFLYGTHSPWRQGVILRF